MGQGEGRKAEKNIQRKEEVETGEKSSGAKKSKRMKAASPAIWEGRGKQLPPGAQSHRGDEAPVLRPLP